MGKRKVVYPCNEKVWRTDTLYNINEPLLYYAQWKESDTKDQILYDPVHMKCLEKANT